MNGIEDALGDGLMYSVATTPTTRVSGPSGHAENAFGRSGDDAFIGSFGWERLHKLLDEARLNEMEIDYGTERHAEVAWVNRTDLLALIAELRASRKVVEAVRNIPHVITSYNRGDSELGGGGTHAMSCPACAIKPYLRLLNAKGSGE